MTASDKKVFIIDLDDTLMWNQYNYDRARIEFLNFLMKIFNRRVPNALYVLTLAEKIDRELINDIDPKTGKRFGFSGTRFPSSLVKLYEALCTEGWGTYLQGYAQQIYKIGLMTFDLKEYKKAGLVPGARRILSSLRKRGDHLALLTKGDPEVQEQKIIALGLDKLFDDAQIVPEKDVALFAAYLEKWKGHGVFSIGNSASDIKPALEAGCGGIFIPCYTWGFESIEIGKLPKEQRERFWQIDTINEIEKIYSQL